jgi:hypothetical protein
MRKFLEEPDGATFCPMSQIGSVLERWKAGVLTDLDANARIKDIIEARRAVAEQKSFRD